MRIGGDAYLMLSLMPPGALSCALSRYLSCYPGLQSNSMLGVADRSGSAGLALSCAVPCALSCTLISDLCCALSTVLSTASIAVLDIKASATPMLSLVLSCALFSDLYSNLSIVLYLLLTCVLSLYFIF